MSYIKYITKVLEQTSIPLSAKEIVNRIKILGLHRLNSTNEITPDQIRLRIRQNNDLFETISNSDPLTYKLKKSFCKLWVLKSVSDADKASQTDSYEDSLTEHYNYDNLVANSQQIAINDLAILIDKETILGFAKIGNIDIVKGSKTIRRCPSCPSTTIDRRKTKKPIYRCNNGHEFDNYSEELKSVTNYRSNFDLFLPIETYKVELKQLRPYYINGYNQNMSMQRLDMKALSLFNGIEDQLLNEKPIYSNLTPNQGMTKEDEKQYKSNNKDEREIALRAIRQRRGQQNFRKKLLEIFNNTCVITGCKIVDILEAAHINPYRGNNDNHFSNGLLLRADIHTLFDLNLISIDPDSMMVHFHPKVKNEYAVYESIVLFTKVGYKPNVEALASHYNIFKSGF